MPADPCGARRSSVDAAQSVRNADGAPRGRPRNSRPACAQLAMAAAALGRPLTPFGTAVLSQCSREEAAAFWGTTTRSHLPAQHPPPTERAPPLPPSPQLQVAGILEHKRPGWRGLLGSSLAAALLLCLVLWSGRSYLPPVSRLAAQQPTAGRQLPQHGSIPILFEIGRHPLPIRNPTGPVCTLAAAGQPRRRRSGRWRAPAAPLFVRHHEQQPQDGHRPAAVPGQGRA